MRSRPDSHHGRTRIRRNTGFLGPRPPLVSACLLSFPSQPIDGAFWDAQRNQEALARGVATASLDESVRLNGRRGLAGRTRGVGGGRRKRERECERELSTARVHRSVRLFVVAGAAVWPSLRFCVSSSSSTSSTRSLLPVLLANL
mmetsp:Transcript_13940/g.41853  ORF Transcript_13940/g.41853 Transcript_13940/m.41853 type:complete len:145 (-) Transcript_13940:126-560(-)